MKNLLILAVLVYTAAMTAANLLVSHFGPWFSPINAFVLIGLDLALRDWLHVRINSRQMMALIVLTGLITYILNPAAGQIAVASSAAFTAAAIADWLVFSLIKGSWMFRANGSNIAGAAVDSLVFPLAAGFPLVYVPIQFIAKVIGGSVWSYLIGRNQNRTHGEVKA